MWNALKNVFERHTLVFKLVARKKFYSINVENEEQMLSYIRHVNLLAYALKLMEVTIDGKKIDIGVLHSHLRRF